jgi:invasion protein IalB
LAAASLAFVRSSLAFVATPLDRAALSQRAAIVPAGHAEQSPRGGWSVPCAARAARASADTAFTADIRGQAPRLPDHRSDHCSVHADRSGDRADRR